VRRLLLLVLFVPAMTWSQVARLTFVTESPRKIWCAESVTETPPVSSTATSAKEVKTPLSKKVLCVLDTATGNLASKPIAGLNAWAVKPSDFNLVGEVQVVAESIPVPATYKFGDRVFDVMNEGGTEASFYGVEPGPHSFEVTYAKDGKNVEGQQTFEIQLERKEAVPTLVIRAKAAPSATSQSAPKPANPTGGGLMGTLLAIFIVAGLAIAVLVFGMRWIYANQDKAQTALGKLGVQVPDPLDPDPTPPTPPASPTPDSHAFAPIVLPGADPGYSSVVATPGVPRLSGPNGSFELSEGVHVLGREAGLTISLGGESTISRRHAELVVSAGQITLRDLGSTNGTFLNGQPVVGDVTVRAGDTIRFGSVQMKLES